jgi:hypothetical protein
LIELKEMRAKGAAARNQGHKILQKKIKRQNPERFTGRRDYHNLVRFFLIGTTNG